MAQILIVEKWIVQTLSHHPVRCLVALLALVVLVFSVDRLGLLTWIAWSNRRAKHQDDGSKQYWRLHW
jgi:hypothetical protein